MVLAAVLSCAATVVISGYSCLTLTYGEEDEEVFHHHDSPQVVGTTHTDENDPDDQIHDIKAATHTRTMYTERHSRFHIQY